MVLQLWHVGRISHPSFQPGGKLPVAPSAIKPNVQAFTANGFEPIPCPRALETDEIPGIVHAICARGAQRTRRRVRRRRGACRERLPDRSVPARSHQQAHRPLWRRNREPHTLPARSGRCGDSGRRRRAHRLAHLAAERAERHFRQRPADPVQPRRERALEQGPHLSSCDRGRHGGTAVPPFDYKEIKRRFGGIVIANNGFDKARANEAIEEGRADLVAFGKPFISNPDLVTRLYLDAPLAPANRETFYGGADQGYTDYPLLRAVSSRMLLLRRRRAGLGVTGSRGSPARGQMAAHNAVQLEPRRR